mmetsp:Transcript_2870/g.6410  ORF Transcript_2870/g.6410 Transcript_2870/m.6410 type:complete len:87 (-) Transcript_2870:57-317(-)
MPWRHILPVLEQQGHSAPASPSVRQSAAWSGEAKLTEGEREELEALVNSNSRPTTIPFCDDIDVRVRFGRGAALGASSAGAGLARR